MRIADILEAKGERVVTVRPELGIEHLVKRLKAERIGAVVVSETGTTVDGIISERDIAYALADQGAGVLDRTVAELMTHGVVTCTPDDTLAHIAKVMTQRRIRHLPVVEGRNLVGIVSIGDVVKHRLAELELEANVLRDYATVRH